VSTREKGRGVFFRLTDEEHEEWQKLAVKEGLTLPAFVEQTARRAIRESSIRPDEPDRLAGIEAELGRVGTALHMLEAAVGRVLAALHLRHPPE
jgi:hypothetical protein